MPGLLDHLFAAVLVIGIPAYAARFSWPQMKQRLATGAPAVRIRTYWMNIALQWILTAAALAIWQRAGRPWTALGLGLETGWRFWTAAGIVAAGLTGLSVNYAFALRSQKDRRRLRDQLESGALFAPRSGRELRHFFALSLTAGVCEEILYRAFLIWYLAAFLGSGFLAMSLAVAAAAAVFGVGHLYQGPKQAAQIFGLALVAGGLYLFSGSLWIVMVMHAGIDIAAGLVSLSLFRAEEVMPAAADRRG